MFVGVGTSITRGPQLGVAQPSTIIPSISGPAIIEQEVTGVIDGLQGGEDIQHVWTLDLNVISGAIAGAFTPPPASYEGALRYVPTVDGTPYSSSPVQVLYGYGPTVSVTPASATILQGTLAASTVATISTGGSPGTLSLSGPDASAFVINNGNLQLAADADTLGNFDVAVDIVNEDGSSTSTFSLTVEEIVSLAVTVGTIENGELPITFQSANAAHDDTVYWVAVAATDDAPSASEIAAGEASGGVEPFGAGTVVWPDSAPDALPDVAGDYRFYAVIDNGAVSDVATSDVFTITAPLANLNITPINVSTYELTGDPMTVDLTGVAAGDWLLISVVQNGVTQEQFDALTIGDGATQSPAVLVDRSPAQARKQGLFKIQCPAAAGGNATAKVDVNVTGGDNDARTSCAVYSCDVEPVLVQGAQATTGNTSTANIATTAGNELLVIGSSYAAVIGDAVTPIGYVEDFEIDGVSGRPHFYGSATTLTTETRVVSATASDSVDLRVTELTAA